MTRGVCEICAFVHASVHVLKRLRKKGVKRLKEERCWRNMSGLRKDLCGAEKHDHSLQNA